MEQLLYKGRAVTYAQAEKLSGIPKATIMGRRQRGLSEEEIFSGENARRNQPKRTVEINGEVHTVEEWAAIAGVAVSTMWGRLQVKKTGLDLIAGPDRTRSAGDVSEEWKRTVDLPWEADLFAQHKVRENPAGMTLGEVASLLGISKERVRQLEEKALAKLKRVRGARKLFEETLLRSSMERGSTMPSSGFDEEECAA